MSSFDPHFFHQYINMCMNMSEKRVNECWLIEWIWMNCVSKPWKMIYSLLDIDLRYADDETILKKSGLYWEL